MAITIDWDTHIINVPQSFLTSLGGSSYSLDTNEFRIALRDIEDNEEGMPHPITHNHNTKVLLGGIEYAQVIEILSPYTITFEDVGSPYRVFLLGSNNNILDVTNLNNVSVAPNNSAGLVQMQEIEFSEHAKGVYLDTINGYPGTLHPIGSQRKPSNNLTDTLQIIAVRGVKKINLMSPLTITSAYDLTGINIEGSNLMTVTLEIGSLPDVDNLSIVNCTVPGAVLDTNVEMSNCQLTNISYMNGHIHDCGMGGNLQLGGNRKSVIADCYTIDQTDPLILDMGGTGNSLVAPDWSGIMEIKNLSDANQQVAIGMTLGQITIDSTVTAGTIIIAGTGIVINNSTGTTIVNLDGLNNPGIIAEAVWGYERV